MRTKRELMVPLNKYRLKGIDGWLRYSRRQRAWIGGPKSKADTLTFRDFYGYRRKLPVVVATEKLPNESFPAIRDKNARLALFIERRKVELERNINYADVSYTRRNVQNAIDAHRREQEKLNKAKNALTAFKKQHNIA